MTILLFHFSLLLLYYYFHLFSPWIPANMVAMEERRRRIIFLLGLCMFCTCLWSMLYVFKHGFCKDNGRSLQFWDWFMIIWGIDIWTHRIITYVWTCRLFVVGFVNRGKFKETNPSEIHHIQIFVWKVGPLYEEIRYLF